jgi:hypothetical protein
MPFISEINFIEPSTLNPKSTPTKTLKLFPFVSLSFPRQHLYSSLKAFDYHLNLEVHPWFEFLVCAIDYPD